MGTRNENIRLRNFGGFLDTGTNELDHFGINGHQVRSDDDELGFFVVEHQGAHEQVIVDAFEGAVAVAKASHVCWKGRGDAPFRCSGQKRGLGR